MTDRNATHNEIINNLREVGAPNPGIVNGVIYRDVGNEFSETGPASDWFVNADGDIYWYPESWQ